ncbi:hypothetical protein [Pseudoduganella albidiflava]|uniref:Serine/threonine protein kinase n=1 Tax=Pseudoduganella albidiflava TaxID=321983 RepID=A0A411WZE4_9BURK|nr:hypothetical protein [Pseudoduganella albidiflava]QBI02063.1 hypothetical protein EYF70_15275 [Pseudoduganella albidiflava]GGY65257.1 hypothetical protein GCM10007387_54470 [Pseudoduganella albidiflava]
MHIHLIAAVAALAFTSAASAQSHSVSNMANPPQTQSDNKAATEATPGKTATAQRNSSKQADKNAGQARNAPTARQAGKVDTSGGSMTGERVGAGSSATATTGIGAGNGDLGAEGAMEIKPSEAYVNPVERRALDEAPKSGKK